MKSVAAEPKGKPFRPPASGPIMGRGREFENYFSSFQKHNRDYIMSAIAGNLEWKGSHNMLIKVEKGFNMYSVYNVTIISKPFDRWLPREEAILEVYLGGEYGLESVNNSVFNVHGVMMGTFAIYMTKDAMEGYWKRVEEYVNICKMSNIPVMIDKVYIGIDDK